ncbi:MAG: phosphate ABC transporter permease PstA [Elusimicrobia bacterium]|nr:phosphate ABC transporter permease PstA [Elusimicrobiota bacterium]
MRPDAASLRRRAAVNALMFGLTGVCALISLSFLFAILGYIAAKGFGALSWGFLVNLPKPVGEVGGGIANSIIGTVKVVGLAGLIGIPLGVGGAVFLAEYGNGRAGFWVRYAADVLNGVPSIVMGIFAYTVVVIPMKHFSALAGSVALAAILIPMVLRTSEEFIRLVPVSVREAALALGLPRWKVILRVVLPTAARGLLTASLLSLSRVAGETAPLIFTAFGNRFWGEGLLHPIATLPHSIFTYAISPYKDWQDQAWAAAFLLLMLVLAVNVVARLALKPAAGAQH